MEDTLLYIDSEPATRLLVQRSGQPEEGAPEQAGTTPETVGPVLEHIPIDN